MYFFYLLNSRYFSFSHLIFKIIVSGMANFQLGHALPDDDEDDEGNIDMLQH